jgi:hypothetical protein
MGKLTQKELELQGLDTGLSMPEKGILRTTESDKRSQKELNRQGIAFTKCTVRSDGEMLLNEDMKFLRKAGLSRVVEDPKKQRFSTRAGQRQHGYSPNVPD